MNHKHFICSALALPAFLSAQAQEAGSSQALPGVTVTGTAIKQGQRAPNLATGSAGSVLETPFSTDSVETDIVRQQGGTTLQEALRNVPGAQADAGFNGSHTQFFVLRGAIADSGTGSNRVLRDGVRLSNYPYVPAFVESVDVLRGPGAAIGVRSEPGGTVNLSTRQPQMSNSGSVYLGVGRSDARELSVDLNRVLSSAKPVTRGSPSASNDHEPEGAGDGGQTALRVIATRSEASQWRHVPDRLDGVKLGLAHQQGERYHLRAGVEATNQTYRPDYGLPALNGRPLDVPRDRQLGEPFGDSTLHNRLMDLHGDVALGAETRLSVDATHLEAHSTSIKNILVDSRPPNSLPPGVFARQSSWEPDTTRRIDSIATTLSGNHATGALMHRWHLGLDRYREKLDQPSLSVPAANSPPIDVYNPVYGQVRAPAPGSATAGPLTVEDLDATGLSAQDVIESGAWSLVAGLRLDRQSFQYGGIATQAVNESRWSPKLGVLHRLSAADTLYANLATGIAPNQVSSSGNQSLPSRRSAQAELGWKSLWQAGQLVSQLAVYRLDQSHMLASDLSTPLNLFDFTIAGSARSQGVEASLRGEVVQGLELLLSYAYTDAVYQDNPLYGGKQVPNVAHHVLNLWGQYRWSDAWRSGAGLYAQGRRYADEANSTVLPGHVRIDLTHAWSHRFEGDRSLDVQLALRNVFDAKYSAASHLHVSRWIMPGQGRNVALSGTYRF